MKDHWVLTPKSFNFGFTVSLRWFKITPSFGVTFWVPVKKQVLA
jgi:hypothetical protein